MAITFLVKKSWFVPLLIVKIVLAAVPIFVFLYILNQNFAFTGVHRVTIHSFIDLPKSVVYAGGAEVGVVSTPNGKQTRPYTDQVKFAVTLPRGFDTLTVKAEFEADSYATIALGAKALTDQSTVYHLPSAYSSAWRSIILGSGALYIKDHSEIQNAETS